MQKLTHTEAQLESRHGLEQWLTLQKLLSATHASEDVAMKRFQELKADSAESESADASVASVLWLSLPGRHCSHLVHTSRHRAIKVLVLHECCTALHVTYHM